MTEDNEGTWAPVAEVLSGVEFYPLDHEPTILEAFVMVKVVDQDGDVWWQQRATNRITKVELLGELVLAADEIRDDIRKRRSGA